MKLRNPSSRYKLRIKPEFKVLDVGGGHNPHPKAQVVVDKYVDDNSHRSGELKKFKDQKFIHAEGENLPFGDKSFDYVIFNHVLEHVDDPAQFLEELFRVGKMGYIETPSLIGEYLFPKESHKWAILEIDEKIVLVDKAHIDLNNRFDFASIFQEYLPKNSIGYKILERTHPNIHTVRIEWTDRMDYLIDPQEEYIKDYFIKSWNNQMTLNLLTKRSLSQELYAAILAFGSICKSIFKSKVLNRAAEPKNLNIAERHV